MKKLHKKIQDLKLRAAPVTMSGSYVDSNGVLQTLDLKVSVSEEDRTVRGYLIVWGVKDTYDTIFVKGCCAKSIRERGPESQAKQKIAHLWQHETDNPTGRFTVLLEDDYGLYFEAELDDVPIGERELKQIRSGTLNQFSVGFNYLWDKMEYDEEQDAVLLYEIELMEGSVVTFGSNAETYALRTPEQIIKDKELLIEDTEEFVKSLPRTKQLELRQLITRHISLATVKPDKPLDEVKPNEETFEIAGYKLNLNEF
jgi:HK97 family phage prohead protease